MADIALIDMAGVSAAEWLALNGAHERETSALSAAAFDRYVATAFYARGTRSPAAFLIAFDQDANVLSPNFHWFRARYSRFVYIDRIIVAAEGRGLGIARRLYLDLFALAAAAGHDTITCEVNSEPPNHASDAFHDRLGFTVVGAAVLAERGKAVRYLVRSIDRRSALR
jgi:hypothetical protein